MANERERAEKLGKAGELEVIKILQKLGCRTRRSDIAAELPNYGWCFVEVKNKEPFSPGATGPPYWAQGLEIYEYDFYTDILKNKGMRCLFVVRGPHHEWLAQFLDELHGEKRYIAGGVTPGYVMYYNLIHFIPLVELVKGGREAPEATATAPPKAGRELERLRVNWRQVTEQAPEETKRTPVIAILRSAGVKPVAVENNTIVIAFRYPIHKEKMEKAENLQVAEKIIGNFLGHSYHVRCQMNKEEE